MTTTYVKRADVLAALARICHAHTQGSLLQSIPVSDRFDAGDRQVIIELYGEKIISLTHERSLRFRDTDSGIASEISRQFLTKSVKALDRAIDKDPFGYDPLRIVTLVMEEFEAIPAYQTYALTL